MLQYGKDKFIAFVRERDLIIVHNWKVVKVIVEPDDSNTNKYWMKPIPGFHETDFPFIICNGWHHFSIVNVRDYYMEPLVNASTKTGLS